MKRRSTLSTALRAAASALILCTTISADVITALTRGMVYDGKTSGVRYLSLLGNTDNKLISTSFASIDQCPSRFGLMTPCVTFKLAALGQLDDMSDHPGATPRQRNFVGSPDLPDDHPSTVFFTIMLEKGRAQPGFFHLAQILDKNGPTWTLSISQHETGNTVDIVDEHNTVCASMLLSVFMSGPMAISIAVHPSEQKLYWTVTDIKRQKTMMICHKVGDAKLGKEINIQAGAYRRVLEDGSTKPAVAHISNFRVQKNRFARYTPKKAAKQKLDNAKAGKRSGHDDDRDARKDKDRKD